MFRGLLLLDSVRGLALAAFPFRTLQPLPNRGLFLRRGPAHLGLGFPQFLTTAAIVDDSVDHAVVILQGHFRRAQRVFRLHGNGYNLLVDAGEQLRPFELLGVLLDHVRGQGREALRSQAHQEGACHNVVNLPMLIPEGTVQGPDQ